MFIVVHFSFMRIRKENRAACCEAAGWLRETSSYYYNIVGNSLWAVVSQTHVNLPKAGHSCGLEHRSGSLIREDTRRYAKRKHAFAWLRVASRIMNAEFVAGILAVEQVRYTGRACRLVGLHRRWA